MALPPRKPKPEKRDTRWRSQSHLAFVRSFQCAVPGCQGMPIEAAHVRIGSGAGISQKPDDWRTVGLCSDHHQQQHIIGERIFWEIYASTAGQTVEQLIDALCKASPKAREIRELRREREAA